MSPSSFPDRPGEREAEAREKQFAIHESNFQFYPAKFNSAVNGRVRVHVL